jgi:hypothetical protein
LPQAVAECQFCGRDVSHVYRHVSRNVQAVNESSGLVWFFYMLIAALWVIDGGYQFASGVGLLSTELSGVSVVIGAFMIVTGLGFLSRNEVFRSHYLPLCFIALCAGVWTAVEGTRTSASNANLGYMLCAVGAARALSAGLMARLAGKTVTHLAR